MKCNHSKELIDSILEYGHPRHGLGLEAGSKAELVLAMSMLSKYPGSNLICNGYKDAEYIELVGLSSMLVYLCTSGHCISRYTSCKAEFVEVGGGKAAQHRSRTSAVSHFNATPGCQTWEGGGH